MSGGGTVGPMEVVVDVPDSECVCAFVFGGPFTGVEELLGEDPVVALHFPVVSRRVWRDPLVARSEQCTGEDLGAVAGPVVGDDPFDPSDAVCSEPGACAMLNAMAVTAFSSGRASV